MALKNGGSSLASKKARSSKTTTSSNGPDSINDKEALIAQKRAKIFAKLAAMRCGPKTPHAALRTPAHTHFAEDVGRRIAEVKRKVAEAQNKLATKDIRK